MATEPARELVVIVDPAAGFRPGPVGAPVAEAAEASPVAALLAEEGAAMRPLFGPDEVRTTQEAARLPGDMPAAAADLGSFYRVEAADERLDRLAAKFRDVGFVQAAYVKPRVDVPVWMPEAAVRMPASPPTGPVPPPAITPDFSGNQTYLDPSPGGVNARFSWTLPGGRGQGVQIIDIEGAWRFTHEDLTQNQGGMVAGTEIVDLRFRDHGTAVVGEIGGDDNGFGVIGIAPDANVRAVSHGGIGLAAAITTAANLLSPGDILLLEAHQPGPRFGFAERPDQRGYIAVQYWPDVNAAITYATVVRGVVVVEAAGNGAEDLDDAIYSAPPLGFPPFWRPFDRTFADNAAIIVGAGAPPEGTHGNTTLGPDRSRLDFSNFAACVDTQGWGAEVTTCGYGGLQGGPSSGLGEDVWYTNQFGGTSSASPIIVGVLACLQGILKAAGKPPLTPIGARNLLRALGPAQQDHPLRPATQRIGNRPDLFLMVAGI